MKAIIYKLLKKVDPEELVILYRSAGWWSEKNDNIEFLDELVNNSFLFLAAYDGSKLIGMGRSISDGISDAYIQDVTVLPEYRRKGIGGEIIRNLVSNLKERGIHWIGLIGEPGTQHFYEELGFERMIDYVPMLYKDKK